MEADQIRGVADAADGNRLIDQPHRAVGVEGRGDDAGVRGKIAQLLVQLRLTQDHAAHVQFQRAADHIRLVAADDDVVLAGEEQIFAALRQGNGNVAGDGVYQIAGLVQDPALQHTQKIKNRDLLNVRALNGAHIVGGDVAGGEHPEERAVLVRHGDRGDGGVGGKHRPGAADGQRARERGRGIIVQIAHLRAHGLDPGGSGESETIQHELRFIADMAKTRSAVFPVSERIAQGGVSHRGNDGVRIRVAVAGDINRIHRNLPVFLLLLSYPLFSKLSMCFSAKRAGKGDCTFV